MLPVRYFAPNLLIYINKKQKARSKTRPYTLALNVNLTKKEITMAILIDDLCLGKETKLSQKFMGKPMYAKLIDFGALPGENSEKSVPHGISNMDQFGIDFGRSFVDQGNGNRHALFYPNTVPNGFWRAKVNETHVAIQAGAGRTSFSAVVCVWYTKRYEIENPGEDHSGYPGEARFTLLGGTGDQTGVSIDRFGDKIILTGSSAGKAMLAEYDSSLKLARSQVYSYGYPFNKAIATPSGYLAVGRNMLMSTNENFTYVKDLTYRNIVGVLYDMYAAPADFEGSLAYISTGKYGEKCILSCIDPNGNIQKTVQATGTSSFKKVIIERDRIIAAGNASNSGLISILDASANPVESILIGTSGVDYFTGFAKRPGGYVAGGYSTGTGSGKNRIILILLDEHFNIEKKVFVAGTGIDLLTDLKVDQAGNIAITASTTSVTVGGTDGLFMLFDRDLNIKSQHTFGGSGNDSYDSLYINNVGNYLIAGTTSSTVNPGKNAFVMQLLGDIEDVNGSIEKYPSLRINSYPNFTVSDQLILNVNRNATFPLNTVMPTINSLGATMLASDITQDPGATIITSMSLDV